jgi:hypothetical protein
MGRHSTAGPSVSNFTPEPHMVAIADDRLNGFAKAWASYWLTEEQLDLKVLMRSCYFQGLHDMADAAARMRFNQEEGHIEVHGSDDAI